MKMKTPEKKVSGKSVIRTQQTVEGIPVEGTWFQEISDKDGVQSYNFHLVEGVPDGVIAAALEMEENKQALIEEAR